MAINFPDSPSLNDTHSDAGRSWKWDGVSWRLEGNSSNYTLPIATSGVLGGIKIGDRLTIDSSTGVLSADVQGGGGATYTIEALSSPGIQLLDDGNAQASNRVFFDAGTGITLTRTSTSPHTIEFSAATFAGTTVGMVPASTAGETTKFLRSDGTWQTVSGGSGTPGGSNQQIQFNDNGSFGGAATFTFDNTTNASNPVATLEGELIIGKDSSSTGPGAGIRVGANKDFEIFHSGASTCLRNLTGEFSIQQANTGGTQMTIHSYGNIKMSNMTGPEYIHMHSGAQVDIFHSGQVKLSTHADGIDITGGIVDKNGDLGTAGQILSSTGTQLDWIDAPTSGVNTLNALTDVNAGSPGDGQVLKWQASTSKWIAAADQTSTGGSGISLTDLSRTNATPGAQAKLDYDNTTGVFTYTPLNMDPWVKVQDTTSTTISRTGSSYLTLVSDFYIQLSADQYVRLDGNNSVNINSSTGPLSVSVAGQITLSAGDIAEFNSTRVDFRDTSNTRYAFFDPSGLNLLTSGIKDKDGNLGTSGQILSSTGTSVDWINAPAAGATTLNELTDVTIASSPANGSVLKYNTSNNQWEIGTDDTGSSVDLSNYVKKTDTTHTTISRSGGNSYFIIQTESYFQCNPDAQCTFDVGAQFAVDAVGQIQLHSDQYVETQSTRVDFKNVAGNATYARFNSTGLNLYTGGIVDKNGSTGNNGQILSTTTGGLDWIDSTSGATTLNELTDVTIATSPANGSVLKYNTSNNQWEIGTDDTGSASATYTLEASTHGASNAQLQLKKDGTTIDSVVIESSQNISYSSIGSGGFQIQASNDNDYVDAISLSGTDLILSRNGLSNLSADLSSLQGSGAETLNDLNDVTVSSSPANGSILKYQTSNNQWVVGTESGGTVTNLTNIGDVYSSGLTTRDILMWNGSGWYPNAMGWYGINQSDAANGSLAVNPDCNGWLVVIVGGGGGSGTALGTSTNPAATGGGGGGGSVMWFYSRRDLTNMGNPTSMSWQCGPKGNSPTNSVADGGDGGDSYFYFGNNTLHAQGGKGSSFAGQQTAGSGGGGGAGSWITNNRSGGDSSGGAMSNSLMAGVSGGMGHIDGFGNAKGGRGGWFLSPASGGANWGLGASGASSNNGNWGNGGTAVKGICTIYEF